MTRNLGSVANYRRQSMIERQERQRQAAEADLEPQRDLQRKGINNFLNGCCHCCDVPAAIIFGIVLLVNKKGAENCSSNNLLLCGYILLGYYGFFIVRNLLVQIGMYCCKFKEPTHYPIMFMITRIVFVLIDSVLLAIVCVYAIGVLTDREVNDCARTL